MKNSQLNLKKKSKEKNKILINRKTKRKTDLNKN